MSVAVADEHRLLTHVGPQVDEVVMNNLFRRKVDGFHWKAKTPSCLCWSQRGRGEFETTTVLNRLMNVNPVPIVYGHVSTRVRNEYQILTKATIDK